MTTEIKFKARRIDQENSEEKIFSLKDIADLRGLFSAYGNWRIFAGVEDKKGVEIYEGDICKYHKNTSKWLVSYHFEVRFKNGAFYAYWERDMMGKLEQHWDLLSQKDMRNIRVVSNILNQQ